ncbi:HlyD family efflux transporter periplasmic adaptor subunit [Halospina sp. K52047b]|uniref:HlyD family secretion protein n=1 Tax=Halospina sp. K52047b TaxID=2614160 RepID=UPI00124A5F4F|nr:HlyD family efflux transporter periplasmic adaptor subunit [Halospina sp. K52047b]KAA8976712.1 HlyD family efflux transporter periplasmic adaptor subunit [Halospina sp. K52047b]
MTGQLFRQEAVAYQRERLWGEILLTQPLSLRLLSAAVAVVLVCLVLYLYLGTYTRKETVQGYLSPAEGMVEVYASQVGTITKLNVEAGDRVDEGEVLARVSTDKTLEEGGTLNTLVLQLLEQQKQRLEQRIERQKRRRDAREVYLRSRIDGHEHQIDQLKEQIQLQKERIELAESRYQSLKDLHRDELISEEEYQARYQTLLDEQQRQNQLRQSLSTEEGELENARFELDSLESETQATLDELRAEIAGLDERRLQHRGEHAFSVEAPRAGRVTSLQVKPGQMASSQRPMMAILPEGSSLEAELLVPSRAIGFVEPDLPVRVRYDAFPHERFGNHESQVSDVAETVLSPDEVDAPIRPQTPVYRVSAELSQQTLMAYGREMPLDAGMTLQADILLDERPLYQWILKPLYSLKGTL